MDGASPRRPARALPSRLLFVADSSHAPGGLVGLVSRAVDAGVRFVELRQARSPGEPVGTGARLAELEACLAAAPAATVLVNDRVDLALAGGAAGAHVGQGDLPVRQARRLLGPDRLLGLSTHDSEQLAAAQDLPIDYVALGPIYPSATKSGHAPPVGLQELETCCRTSRLPVVAIGGITAANAGPVIEAGAACLAVAAGIADGDIETNARRLLRIVAASGPEHWFLTGFSGAGKTAVGRRLAALSGRRFVDLDELVVQRAGTPVEVIFSVRGEPAFRELEARVLAELLAPEGVREALVIALGGGTLEDPHAAAAIEAAGTLACLDVPLEECLRRLRDSLQPRPLVERALQQDAGAGKAVRALFDRRSALHARAAVRVQGADEIVAVAARLHRALAGRHGRSGRG